MPKPTILLLESDPGTAQLLQAMLTEAGFEVHLAENAEQVMSAIQVRTYTGLVADCHSMSAEVTTFVMGVQQTSPDTAIICTAGQPGLSLVLGAMRSGATDFIAKPFIAADALERVRSAMARHRVERAGRRELEQRALRAEEKLRATEQQLSLLRAKSSESVSPASAFALAVRDFADVALRSFTEMEREHLEILRRSLPNEDPTAAARMNAHTRTFIAHHDPDFVRNLVKRGEQLKLEFKPPLTTGGEVLDKIGHSAGEIIIVGDELPDIPSQMVVETIQSQHPDVSIVYIEQWATANQSVTLYSGHQPEPVSRLMRNVADLVATLDLARERSQQSLFSREFAERFRSKHEDFIRKYTEIKAFSAAAR